MRFTYFKIEPLGYEIFEGYTKDEDWNGWACPYFNYEQAQKVLRIYNELRRIIGQKDFAYYEPSADSFVFPVSGEREPENFMAIADEGQKYYSIGAFCWIWEEVDEE